VLTDESKYQLRRAMRRLLNRFIDTAQFDRLYSRGEDINEEFFTTLDQRPKPTAPFFRIPELYGRAFPVYPAASLRTANFLAKDPR